MEFWRFDHLMQNNNHQITGHYDFVMVGLSFLVMFIASLAVKHVSQSIKISDTRIYKYLWITFGALVMGLGIWSMHFIGMLAFKLPVFVAYNLEATLLSIPPAIFASSVFLILLTKDNFTKFHFYISSCSLAIGIGLMHFLGMEALEGNIIMRYQFDRFVYVIILALLLSTLSLYIFFYKDRISKGFRSYLRYPFVMAFSVSCIHYAGMWSTHFYAITSDFQLKESLLSTSQLGLIIASGSCFLIFLLIIATKINARFKLISPLSNEYIRAIVNNSAEAIITIKDDSLIQSFNRTAEKIFGYSAEEIIGKNINLLMPESLRAVHDDYVKNSTIHAPRIFNKARDLLALKKDGALFPIELNVSPMNIKGEKVFIGILHDISERKKQEQLLAESQTRFQQLTEIASDWIWETDNEHKISFLSESFQKITGFPIEAILGSKREQLTAYDLDDNNWNEYTKILDQQDILKNFKFALKGGEDKLKYMMISGKPVINKENKFIGYRGTGSDITELTQAKKDAEKANKAKSHFLSSMSHELRTPLNSILGFSQLMEDDPDEPLTDDQADSVKHIIKSGKHLLTLINDILDLSKIESGNIELSIEALTINTILDECISLITPFAEINEISITQQNRPDDTLKISADYTRIKQVVLNLLSNAIKYNFKNGTVTLFCEPVNDNNLRIIIKDMGFGIAKEKQSKLFSPFERLGEENSDIEGTGIGLVVCKELMEKMNGTIGFKSEKGLGSSFWAEIPLANGNEQNHNQTETVFNKIEQSNDNVSGIILYIEDNPANVHLMEKIIIRYPGLSLISAHSAELGLSIAYSKNITLIFMDINLPGINGIKALQELKSNPATSSIPIVAVSAEATKKDIERGIAAGFDRYLSKPIHVPDIKEVINKYCIK